MSPADGVDWYDIHSIRIRDARSEIRGEIADAVADLRSDVAAIADELRETIAAERVDRQDAIESLQRVLDARTERFV